MSAYIAGMFMGALLTIFASMFVVGVYVVLRWWDNDR